MSSLPDLRFVAGLFVALVLTLASHAAPPVVSNVHASQAGANQPVKIFYDLQDADSATVRVSLLVSEDGGGTWNVPAQSLSGFGFGVSVTPGSDRYILWNAPADWPGHQPSLVRFRVVVNDDPIPAGMVPIPAGNFQMGNALSASGDSFSSELPLHTIYVSAFYMDRYEVTKAMWERCAGMGADTWLHRPSGKLTILHIRAAQSGHAIFCRGAIKTGQHCAIKSGKMRDGEEKGLAWHGHEGSVLLPVRRIGLCGDAT